MIISNEKKFIYLRVPKTGSTSISVYFYENLPLESSILRTVDRSDYLDISNYPIKDGYFNVEHRITLKHNTHSTLQCAIDAGLLEHDVSEYSVYGVLRNPVDRFKSYWSMTKVIEGNDMVQNFNVFKTYMNLFGARPQTTWLKHSGSLINRLFLYEDVPALVEEIALKYDVTNTDNFTNYNFRSYQKQNEIPDRVLNYLESYWEEDFELYANLKKSNAS